MADYTKLDGMIDSTPIMKDYADIESSKLPEFQLKNGPTIKLTKSSLTPPTNVTSMLSLSVQVLQVLLQHLLSLRWAST